MVNFVIKDIIGRQILDSRGNPTVEAEVILESGALGRASVASGASTGSNEALELRDNEPKFYGGKGVSKAVWHVNHDIHDLLVGNSAEQKLIDQLMIEMDGTNDKSRLGANAILAVSLAAAKAVAAEKNLPFYKYIAEIAGTTDKMCLPRPMVNVMNGGCHADWATEIQEYMIIPHSAGTMAEAVRMSAEVFHTLKNVLKEHQYATTVGDEGGYAPKVSNNLEPLDLILEAIDQAGYKAGKDIALALDVAASEFYEGEAGKLIDWYGRLTQKYPIISIEDGLREDDWQGWAEMTAKLGSQLQLVGDDLFVTNVRLLERGISEKAGNAILIKPNQIGTLSETIDAVLMAQKAGFKTVISHRSGETEDTAIAHIAVGLGAGQIKTGSMSRGERMVKYNELLRIAEAEPELKLAL